MKFKLSTRSAQDAASPSMALLLSGDIGFGLGKGIVSAAVGAGSIRHFAGVAFLQFKRSSQWEMRSFFKRHRLPLPLFIPETDEFSEGFFNDPAVAWSTYPKWWGLVLQVINDLEWSFKQRGICPSLWPHVLSNAGHYPVGVTSAAEVMKRWPAPATKHIGYLAIPTEPALVAIFEEVLAAYLKAGFDLIVLTDNARAAVNDMLIKAKIVGLLKAQRFDHAYPPPANAAHRVDMFASTGLSTISGAQSMLPLRVSPRSGPWFLPRTVELRDDQLVNDTCDLVHRVVEEAEASSLGVVPHKDLTITVVVATPLPSQALDYLKKRVEERLNLERPSPGQPTWMESHPGVEIIFAPSVVPIDVAHARTAIIVGAWYPITDLPQRVQKKLDHGKYLQGFRRSRDLPSPAIAGASRVSSDSHSSDQEQGQQQEDTHA